MNHAPSLNAVHAAVKTVLERIKTRHTKEIPGMTGRVFLISDTYPGVWMEHVYDAIAWVNYSGQDHDIALNQTLLFLDHQTEAGQFPFRYMDLSNPHCSLKTQPGNLNHIQECVSFARLCLEAYRLNPLRRDYLEEAYRKNCLRDKWMVEHRMQTGRGLIEMYCGYDTGHDNSGRLNQMKYPGNFSEDAGELPHGCPVAPMLAPDMNANFYGDRIALAEMADELNLPEEASGWRKKAEEIREKMMELLFDEKDCFFYDRDKNGNLRKNKNISITNVICENVCSPELANEIYERHLANPAEFASPYPFPSMSMDDPTWRQTMRGNSWGFYSQGLTALRTLRWMKRYGREAELHSMMEKWVSVFTNEGDTPFAQELHPLTGKPSECSSYYSATMLYYLHAARELGLTD